MRRLRQENGFTLVELLVAMPVLLIMLAGLTTVFVQLNRSNDRTQQQTVLQSEARESLNTLEADIRQAFTGDGSNPFVTATATSFTVMTPDRYPTVVSGSTVSSFHLRKVTYSVASNTLQTQQMTSTNVYPTAPPWTWPGSMGAWRTLASQVSNTDVFTYYTDQGMQATPPTPLSFPITDTTGISAVGVKLTITTTGPNPQSFTTQETVALRSTA
jgi:prepilin-type N-terminal cleavage/methylation domain-containing protein